MTIQSLGYIAIGSDNLADWSDYATNFLGMQRVERWRDEDLVFV